MKLLAGCVVSAGLVLSAGSANAQMLAPRVLAPNDAGRPPYQLVSDFEEPYSGMPPSPPPYGAPPPYPPAAAPYGAVPYGYAPALLPPHEIYAVLRENGFLPLGIPRRQGYVYEIAAMDPNGEDGRLSIDARDGRIIRFTPAYWMGRSHEFGLSGPYGAQAALPPPTVVRGVPRPPAPIPHVASRTVPLPAPKPAAATVEKPAERTQQSATASKPAEAAAATQPQASASAQAPATTGAVVEVKPLAPQIKPTQDMPAVQGLE
jgi:hypothetical protein